MNLSFKPMLACSTIPELEDIKYPVLVSPKLDGIRCLAGDGIAWSRTMKRIPNKCIQNKFKELRLHGLDGELYMMGMDFNEIQSIVMSEYHHDQSKIKYCVFDSFHNIKAPFESRLQKALCEVDSIITTAEPNDKDFVYHVRHFLVHDAEDMSDALDTLLKQGFEGAIVRDPKGPYKNGRSTMNQGWMLKLKKFYDDEAIIIDVEELMHNDDTSTKKKENMVAGDTLGALVVRWKGKQFKIGTGFDQNERDTLWAIHQQGNLVEQHVTFKYQEVSQYGVPRFPVYKGVRYDHR